MQNIVNLEGEIEQLKLWGENLPVVKHVKIKQLKFERAKSNNCKILKIKTLFKSNILSLFNIIRSDSLPKKNPSNDIKLNHDLFFFNSKTNKYIRNGHKKC
jgi:hypothetical protein